MAARIHRAGFTAGGAVGGCRTAPVACCADSEGWPSQNKIIAQIPTPGCGSLGITSQLAHSFTHIILAFRKLDAAIPVGVRYCRALLKDDLPPD
jgi:hypothetical protein